MIRSLYISYNAITEPIVQSQVIPYLRGLAKKGVKFYLLTFEKRKMGIDEEKELLGMLKEEFREGPDLEWLRLRYHKKPVVPATVFDIVTGFLYAAYIIVIHKIDVIHARAIVGALVGFPAAKILSRKIIFDTRGIDSEEYVDAGLWKKGGFRHRLVGFFEGILTRYSDRVIVLTNAFSDILRKKYPGSEKKFTVIPCAVDTERFKSSGKKNSRISGRLGVADKFVVTYAGSLGTWYMLSEMIEFFKVMLKIVGNAHFLLLTQTDRNYAARVMKDHGLNMDMVTIDTISHYSMADYLSFSDAGLFFIKPVFSKISSSPVKFAEYLACGLPVIINSGIGDTEEIVRSNRVGLVVDDFSETSYERAAEGLQALKADTALASRCRSLAEKDLSLESAVNKYNALYEELLASEKKR